MAAEIPKLFKALKDEAKPMFILKKPEDAMSVERELDAKYLQTGATSPAGRQP